MNEQQHSPEITVRRACAKELQNFFYNYRGKTGEPLASKTQNNLRATVLHFFKYHIGEPEDYNFTLGTQQLKK